MRRRPFLLTALSVLVPLASLFAAQALTQEREDVVVRVTSATAGQQVAFRGAYVFSSRGLRSIQGTTPFEVTGSGELSLGVFERRGDGPDLKVEVRYREQSATGTADRVIVGTNVLHGAAGV